MKWALIWMVGMWLVAMWRRYQALEAARFWRMRAGSLAQAVLAELKTEGYSCEGPFLVGADLRLKPHAEQIMRQAQEADL